MDADRVKGATSRRADRTLEDAETIRLKIRHYQELLKHGRHTEANPGA